MFVWISCFDLMMKQSFNVIFGRNQILWAPHVFFENVYELLLLNTKLRMGPRTLVWLKN